MEKTLFHTPDTLDCRQAFKEAVREKLQPYEHPHPHLARLDGRGRVPDDAPHINDR